MAWPVDAVRGLGSGASEQGAAARIVVVAGVNQVDALGSSLAGRGVEVVPQERPLGTGHAVLAARETLAGATGPLLILYGDCPLVTPALLEALVHEHASHPEPLTLLTVRLDDPTGYGRVVRGADGTVQAVVEEADADEHQKAIQEANSGIWVVDLPTVWERLEQLGQDNAQGEIYLTDLVGQTVASGGRVRALCWPEPEDLLGFNDQSELARVRGVLRRRILETHLRQGVEIVDPATTYIDAEVSIAPGARILPCTMIEGAVSIATGCVIGPFTHLREGTVLLEGARVGNFTETKKSTLGVGVKANHLSYLGDTTIGAGTNIGAGTITANYDGRHKHPTDIGERVFIGSGTVIVAPARVGDGGMTGAGAIVTRDTVIGEGEVWVGLPARLMRRTVPATREPPA